MALPSNTVVTADTSVAVAQMAKLDQTMAAMTATLDKMRAPADNASNAIEQVAQKASPLDGIFSALSNPVTLVTGGLAGLATGFFKLAESETQTAIALSPVIEALESKAGPLLTSLTKATGGLIDVNALAATANKMMMSDFNYTQKQIEAMGKAAVQWADEFGISEEESLSKLTKAIMTGKKLDTLLMSRGINVELVGTKAEKSAQALKLLEDRFGGMEVKAANAEERAKALANETKMIKAYALGGESTIFEDVTRSAARAKNEVWALLHTGKSWQTLQKEMEAENAFKMQIQHIEKLTAGIKSMNAEYEKYLENKRGERGEGMGDYGKSSVAQVDEYGQLDRYDEVRAKRQAIQDTITATKKEMIDLGAVDADKADLTIQQMDKIIERRIVSGEAEGNELAILYKLRAANLEIIKTSADFEAYQKSLSARRGEIVNAHLYKEKLAVDQVNAAWQALSGVTQKVFGMTADAAVLAAAKAAKAWGKKLNEKTDQELVSLQQARKAAQFEMEVALEFADEETVELKKKAYSRASDLLEIYKEQGKAAKTQLEQDIFKRNELEDQYNKAQLDKAIAHGQALRALKVQADKDEMDKIDKAGSWSQLKTEGLTLLGAEKNKLDELEKAHKALQWQVANGEGTDKIRAEMALAGSQEEINALKEKNLWQLKIQQDQQKADQLLAYTSLGGESKAALTLKQQEFDLSVAMRTGNKEEADAISKKILLSKEAVNEYGKLQNELNKLGAGWKATQQITDMVFKASAQAIFMSNAELKKAGKTRGQILQEQLAASLKTIAIENFVQGGSKLALAIAATVLAPPTAPALYASSATHFAVAALAGGAGMSMSKSGAGAPKDDAKATKTETGATSGTNNVNYVYNMSNMMLLSDPDKIVSNYRGIDKSYAERKN